VVGGTRGFGAAAEIGGRVDATREVAALLVRALLFVVSFDSSPALFVSVFAAATLEVAVTRLLRGAVPGRDLGGTADFVATDFSVSSGLSGFFAAVAVLLAVVLVAVFDATCVLDVNPATGLLAAGLAPAAAVDEVLVLCAVVLAAEVAVVVFVDAAAGALAAVAGFRSKDSLLAGAFAVVVVRELNEVLVVDAVLVGDVLLLETADVLVAGATELLISALGGEAGAGAGATGASASLVPFILPAEYALIRSSLDLRNTTITVILSPEPLFLASMTSL